MHPALLLLFLLGHVKEWLEFTSHTFFIRFRHLICQEDRHFGWWITISVTHLRESRPLKWRLELKILVVSVKVLETRCRFYKVIKAFLICSPAVVQTYQITWIMQEKVVVCLRLFRGFFVCINPQSRAEYYYPGSFNE